MIMNTMMRCCAGCWMHTLVELVGLENQSHRRGKKPDRFSWFLWWISLQKCMSAVGGLTAFRDFIHRLPRKCKFISSLGASFTLQSMEMTSELLWFCKGRSLWSITAEKGIKPLLPHSEGSETQTPVEEPHTRPPHHQGASPSWGASPFFGGHLGQQSSARGQDQAHGDTYQVEVAGQVLFSWRPPVVGGVSPNVAGCVLLQEKPMSSENGDKDHGSHFPASWPVLSTHPSGIRGGSSTPQALLVLGAELGSLWDAAAMAAPWGQDPKEAQHPNLVN